MEWRLADAKNRFSELVNKALSTGPQRVHRRQDKVIVISEKDYQRLIGEQVGFKHHLLHPPHSMEDIVFERDSSPMRTFEL
jgi:prevent-host-death family protein